ncbi:methyltransferase [Actinomycetes bacterium]|nr:methyltransferase [Actinomycetes bacterium]
MKNEGETSAEGLISDVALQILKLDELVRVVLSGARKGAKPSFERIDIRPVLLKEIPHYQVLSNDGRQTTTKNYLAGELKIDALLNQGYANILVEHLAGSIAIQYSKKDKAIVHRSSGNNTAELTHDRVKERLLKSSDAFLIEVGISDSKGVIKPSRQDKYKQVEEFLRLLWPTLTSAIESGHIKKPSQERPLKIVDLGSGSAYLTFAVHQFLTSQSIPIQVVGIDNRPEFREKNSEIAKKLGISKTIQFKVESISDTTETSADIAIALHACDTATDDAISWAVKSKAKLLLIAPCCHHDIQKQLKETPEPWSLLTKYGLMRERLSDLLTDTFRAQIIKLLGYRVEVIEFIGGEHTPRNLMIRALFTGAKPEREDRNRYEELVNMWKVSPVLSKYLAAEMEYSKE